MKLSKRADGPELVIDFSEPIHVEEVTGPDGKPGWNVWTRWRNNGAVGFAAPGDLEHCKRSFWDACLIQYVGELRQFAAGAKN